MLNKEAEVREKIETKVRAIVKGGFQHDYDRMDNLVPVFNEAEVVEKITELALSELEAARKENARVFKLLEQLHDDYIRLLHRRVDITNQKLVDTWEKFKSDNNLQPPQQ